MSTFKLFASGPVGARLGTRLCSNYRMVLKECYLITYLWGFRDISFCWKFSAVVLVKMSLDSATFTKRVSFGKRRVCLEHGACSIVLVNQTYGTLERKKKKRRRRKGREAKVTDHEELLSRVDWYGENRLQTSHPL
jgi:hypothetical protein